MIAFRKQQYSIQNAKDEAYLEEQRQKMMNNNRAKLFTKK